MDENTKDRMAALDECLAVKDEDGRVVLQVAQLATVYFKDPYKSEVREAVAACCDDYVRRCGPHLRWAWSPNTEYMDPFGQDEGSDPASWLPTLEEDDQMELTWSGAEDKIGASAFSLDAFGPERRQYETLGNFRVSFPLLWFDEHSGSLAEVLLDICRKIKPDSGYGGIGVIESPHPAINSIHEPIVYEWGQRFPGLEVDYPIEHGIWLRKGREGGKGGIKGANWLTVVGDRWLAELGGADTVASEVAALDSRYVVHRFEGGVMIQAGPHPELGIAEHDLWPELYVKLAKYLKPIRITRTCPFQTDGPGERFDKVRSEAWLRRFDDR